MDVTATETKSLSHDELRLLYEVTVSDLSYFKTQQWSLTNYTLLLLASLVAAAQILKSSLSLWECLTLIGLAVLTASGALVILYKLQDSIRIRRARLEKIRGEFSSAFNEAWSAELKSREYFHAVYFLRVAVILAAIAVCWLIYRIREPEHRITQPSAAVPADHTQGPVRVEYGLPLGTGRK
jgi:hypothetical protein